MSRRIELELTSRREDGTWTWRAAGARQPKGDLDGALLPDGAAVGDVLRADADFLLDGIVITSVLAPKGARKEPERLEVLGPPRRDDQLVTTQLAPRERGGRGRREGQPRRDGDGRREGEPRRERRDRPAGDRDRGERGERRERRPRPAPEPKPKPKRLRAGRTHRNAALAALPEERKPVAEQVLRGGIPAVRQAVEKQNEANRAEGKPEISPEPLLAMAEEMMPALRTAEWRDRAEAALADVAEVDLRDLRSVVVAADAAARDDETRELAESLRTALAERVEAEHTAWLADLSESLEGGRVVRALRLSSRPPKAGAPLPPELATALAEATKASLTAETGSDRFATVLDALAYSPVRGSVTAEGIPAEPGEQLLAAVRKLASRLPAIAAQFGVEAPTTPPKGKGRGRGKARPRPSSPPPPPPPAPAADVVSPSETAPSQTGRSEEAAAETPAMVEPGAGPAGQLDPGTEAAGMVEPGPSPAGQLDAGTEAAGALSAAPAAEALGVGTDGPLPVAATETAPPSEDAGTTPAEPDAPGAPEAQAAPDPEPSEPTTGD